MEIEGYKISKLDENEKVLLVVKKHWFVVLIESLPLVVFLIVPILFYTFTNRINPEWVGGDIFYLNLGVAAASVLAAWVIFFIIWTDYYLDSWLITNRRIIDIEQKGLFSRDIATLRLDKIQDATFSLEGIIATLMGFGEIRIQTAGTQTEFKMTHVGNPRKVTEAILQVQHKSLGK